jgi:hypothetical protein
MRLQRWLFALSVACCSSLLIAAAAQDNPPSTPPTETKPAEAKADDGVQVENRGPVHEAFANPGAPTRGGEGYNAPKAPPPPVPELPPDEKPTGDNVTWIPGYWQYDGEKKDFIWVSGFWRNAPPGRVWSAGEWKVENGQHRYIPGYWKQTNENSWRVDLPEPPKSVEAGPNVPAPHKDAIWIPGHWVHRDSDYAWRPGYWGEVEDNMVWMPSQYVYTGSGYRFVNGYWDYCLEDRGLLYAPVTFSQPLWLNPGWAFRPRFGLNIGFGGGWGWGYGGFYDNLYCGPGLGNFWFGNFGSPWGWGAGFRPWCWNGFRGFGNPVFNHYCWLNRGNIGWRNGLQQTFAARQMGVLPGVNRQVNGNLAGGRQFNVNQNSLNNVTNLVSRVGGERAGQQLADRVNKGATIQQVNNAIKQTSSSNLVQPAREVLKNQRVAQSLPSKSTVANERPVLSRSEANTVLNRMADNSRRSTEVQMRSQITDAVRRAPTGTIGRTDVARPDVTRSTSRGSSDALNTVRNMSGSSSNQNLRLSSGNNIGRTLGDSGSSSGRSSVGSGNSSSAYRNIPSTGGSSSRGSIGGSGSSSRPSVGGNFGGSSRPSVGGSNFGGSSSRPSVGGSNFGGSRPSVGGSSFGGSRPSTGGSMGGSRGAGGGGGRAGGGGKR